MGSYCQMPKMNSKPLLKKQEFLRHGRLWAYLLCQLPILPLKCGHVGHAWKLCAPPNILTNECDVLIAVGMRFDDRVTGDVSRYAKQAKVIHLEIDPAEINKNVEADVPVLGNCKESLTALLEKVNENQHPKWLARFNELNAEEERKVIKDELNPQADEPMSMGEVIKHILQYF